MKFPRMRANTKHLFTQCIKVELLLTLYLICLFWCVVKIRTLNWKFDVILYDGDLFICWKITSLFWNTQRACYLHGFWYWFSKQTRLAFFQLLIFVRNTRTNLAGGFKKCFATCWKDPFCNLFFFLMQILILQEKLNRNKLFSIYILVFFLISSRYLYKCFILCLKMENIVHDLFSIYEKVPTSQKWFFFKFLEILGISVFMGVIVKLIAEMCSGGQKL